MEESFQDINLEQVSATLDRLERSSVLDKPEWRIAALLMRALSDGKRDAANVLLRLGICWKQGPFVTGSPGMEGIMMPTPTNLGYRADRVPPRIPKHRA